MAELLDSPALLIPLIFSLLGLVLSVIGVLNYVKAKKSATWITTTANIVSSEVTTGKDSQGNTVYKPDVCYSYRIQGEEYFSNRVRFLSSSGSGSSAKAHEVIKKFPAGSQVTIYYNPENPKDSVIEPGVSSGNIVFLVIALILFTAPLVIAYIIRN